MKTENSINVDNLAGHNAGAIQAQPSSRQQPSATTHKESPTFTATKHPGDGGSLPAKYAAILRQKYPLPPARQVRLGALMDVLETSPISSSCFKESLKEIAVGDYLALAGNFNEFCTQFLGWPDGAGARFMELGDRWTSDSITGAGDGRKAHKGATATPTATSVIGETPTKAQPLTRRSSSQASAAVAQSKVALSTLNDETLPVPRLPSLAKTALVQPQPVVDADESSTGQPLEETTRKAQPVPSSPLRRLKASQAMSTTSTSPPAHHARPATDAIAPQEAAVDDAGALPANPVRRLKGTRALSTKHKISPAPTDDHQQADAVVPKAKGDATTTALATGTNSDPQVDGKQSPSQEVRTDKLQPSVEEEVVVVPLSAITLDESIQCRAALHKATVNQYAERMKAGDCFPALIVYKVDDRHLLADGFHRFRAAEKAGLTSLPMVIRQGTRRDAIKFAIESNAKHGLPRTNADKRRSVALALQEFADFSEHVIADLCKVSQPFVGKVRRQLITVISSETRVGRDGKRRKMPKKKAQSEQDQSAGTKATEHGSGTGEHAAGTANDESDRTTTSHEGATGQEQATQAQSSDESDEQDTGGSAADYSLDEAWSRISEFLMKEFSQCPESMRTELVERLGRFIDRQT